MRNKNQGEGDYEAARRFNKQQKDFVQRKFGKHKVVADFDLERTQDLVDDVQGETDPQVTERDDDEHLHRQGIDLPRQRDRSSN